MRYKSLVTAILGLVVVASPAWADDIVPPAWRGLSGSSWAEWEYSTPIPNPAPDRGFLPYGMPTTQVYPGVGQNWWDILNGRQGVWPLSGEIWIGFPNQQLELPYKDIYLQLTWEEQAPGNRPIVLTTAPQQINGTLVHEVPLGGLWKHSIYTIRLEPNPPWEQILITGGVDVDQVVIDTRCFPEPATLGLLAMGGVALLRRR